MIGWIYGFCFCWIVKLNGNYYFFVFQTISWPLKWIPQSVKIQGLHVYDYIFFQRSVPTYSDTFNFVIKEPKYYFNDNIIVQWNLWVKTIHGTTKSGVIWQMILHHRYECCTCAKEHLFYLRNFKPSPQSRALYGAVCALSIAIVLY